MGQKMWQFNVRAVPDDDIIYTPPVKDQGHPKQVVGPDVIELPEAHKKISIARGKPGTQSCALDPSVIIAQK